MQTKLKTLERDYAQAKENYREGLAKVGQLEDRIESARNKFERLLEDHRQATGRKKFFLENCATGHADEADLVKARQTLALVEIDLENAREELESTEAMHKRLREDLGTALFNRRNTAKAALFGAIAQEQAHAAVEKSLDEMAEAFAAWCKRSDYISDIDAALRVFLFNQYAPVIGPRLRQAHARLAEQHPAE